MRSAVSQISIHKLEVFCLVAELQSLSRAAERLGIAQPVVSAHIKSLSAKLDNTLVTRNGRRIALTPEGERAYRWARAIVNQTTELEREIFESKQGVQGTATLSASMTLGSYVLPALISEYRRRKPKGTISVRIATPSRATEALRNGECDFAFTILDPRHETSGLTVKRICDEELILVGSGETTQPGMQLMPEELHKYPFVTAQTGTPRREIEEEALEPFDVERNIELEFGHAEAIKQAVRAKAGLAFLFRSSVRDELASGALRQIATPGMALKVPVYCVHRKDKILSSYQKSLMTFIAEGISTNETAGHETAPPGNARTLAG